MKSKAKARAVSAINPIEADNNKSQPSIQSRLLKSLPLRLASRRQSSKALSISKSQNIMGNIIPGYIDSDSGGRHEKQLKAPPPSKASSLGGDDTQQAIPKAPPVSRAESRGTIMPLIPSHRIAKVIIPFAEDLNGKLGSLRQGHEVDSQSDFSEESISGPRKRVFRTNRAGHPVNLSSPPSLQASRWAQRFMAFFSCYSNDAVEVIQTNKQPQNTDQFPKSVSKGRRPG